MAFDRGRKERAASFGATACWTAGDPSPVSYEAVIDCAGDHLMPATALVSAEPTGRLVCIGIGGVQSLIDSCGLMLGDMTAAGILAAPARRLR